MTNTFLKRQAALRQRLAAAHLDALIVSHAPDWYYLTGFTGESGALVVGPRQMTLVTDGRFMTQAREETSGVGIFQHKAGLFSAVGEFLRSSGKRRAGFDPTQFSVAQHKMLRKAAGGRCALKSAIGFVAGRPDTSSACS